MKGKLVMYKQKVIWKELRDKLHIINKINMDLFLKSYFLYVSLVTADFDSSLHKCKTQAQSQN